jgi:hypothetical protein
MKSPDFTEAARHAFFMLQSGKYGVNEFLFPNVGNKDGILRNCDGKLHIGDRIVLLTNLQCDLSREKFDERIIEINSIEPLAYTYLPNERYF